MGNADLDNVSDWLQAVNMLPSLLELHLRKCGLVSLPQSISFINFTLLSVLDLSGNNFKSPIPCWLSNVSGLSILNIANNYLHGAIPDAFANLYSLKELDLSGNGQIEGLLPAGLGNLTNLHTLSLRRNNVTGVIPKSFANLCNLRTFDLELNNIGGEVTELVHGLSQCSNSNLESLYLSGNELLGGNMPYSLGELKNLKSIELKHCSFWGSIPDSIGNLSSLEILDLQYNQMNGSIPESIGKLSKILSLDLGNNSWNGVLNEAHFQNLSRLERLDLSSDLSKSTLALEVHQDWVPPFKLRYVDLHKVHIGPWFPTWLQTQDEIWFLNLNNVGISDTIPHGFWNSCSSITNLSMSGNKLYGQVPCFQILPSANYIDLSSNKFEGPLPLCFSNLSQIYLNDNMFSGPIPENIGELLPRLSHLDLSSNFVDGKIPLSIGMLKNLTALSLRNNTLSGHLPPCWEDLQYLYFLDIANNNISGSIPISMQNLTSLSVLSLHQNHFEGKFPSFFRNYKQLRSLDVSRNRFFGNLPTWIGENLPYLLRLNLRSNFFSGHIPQQLCLLVGLRILDLAHNEFSGGIPPCLGNFTDADKVFRSVFFVEKMSVVSKGRDYLYHSTLDLVYSIDLSCNNLSGEIPDTITSFSSLVSLNLSINHLNGGIPENIENLNALESLDLSRNAISGSIPDSLASLNFLSHLNLSFNNLSGKIPHGNQLQTLNDPSIYQGNSLLCGHPLLTKCLWDETEPGHVAPIDDGEVDENNEDGTDSLWFYASVVVGFVVGFWGVCGTLIVKTSWRLAYFRMFDNLKNKIAIFFTEEVGE
ncbi:receptor-like protein EIX2 [Juglans regia]|uniref:Receptor-like protein EIX2 n=1 Tax=Juglans regia TaxID=51240 RepID=A0A6P9EA82_JUGRE|nr:receptor-like protein EIX2 [Juglans regia]